MTGLSKLGGGPSATYGLKLERVRLRALRLAESTSKTPRDQLITLYSQQLAQLDAEIDQAAPGREAAFAANLGLTPEVLDFLWTVVALTGDPRVQSVLQLLVGSEARSGVSLALHAGLAELGADAVRTLALTLGPAHPLRRGHLLLVSDDAPGGTTFSVPHRLMAFLAGDDTVDPMLEMVGGVIVPPLDLRWDEVQDRGLERIMHGLRSAESMLLVVEGPREVGRRTALAQMAAHLNLTAVALDLRRVAPTLPALESALAALRRECLLRSALPVVVEVEDLRDGENESPRMRALVRMIEEVPGPFALVTSHPGLDLAVARRILRVPFPAPDTATRQALWQRALGDAAPPQLGDISMRYRLGAGGIARAAASARVIARGRSLTDHDLIEGVRNDIAERLGGLAQRVEVKQSWDDLVLAPDLLDQVRAVVARVRHAHLVLEQWGFRSKLPRGLGVAAMFSGPPGTGKSMVAGLIARELDLELYQVDLSKVVSKWVGETEKQLSKLFEAAEAGHALLLFDEADSLFAKRTEVKGSNDRYANLEVNYLLQRIESFGGITLLTTNKDTSIDPALRRRLSGHIIFWPPDVEERTTFWRRMLAPGAPLAKGLDFEKLANQFPDMTGANIRNAAIAAAFLAAAEGSEITQSHLERAGKGEYSAMGRVLK